MASTVHARTAARLLLRPRLSPRPSSLRSPLSLSAPSKHSFRSFCVTQSQHADIIVKVPPMAESISEGTLASLLKQVGEQVEADEELASIETDKIDVAVNAPEAGVLREVFVAEGEVVTVGQDIARIETGVEGASPGETKQTGSAEAPNAPENIQDTETPDPSPSSPVVPPPEAQSEPESTAASQVPQQRHAEPVAHSQHSSEGKFPRAEREEKMSRMRRTIATRLKQSQNECASLTTLQEVDMTNLIAWRARHRDEVAARHGVRLGYMGAFVKATTLAARAVPEMNAAIDMAREVVIFRDYVDVSIAVSAPKGLVTPVVRNAESLSVVELEREVAALAKRAREGKLTMPDLEGGNYSISNPGIFGSMFGTPLINYPQAAVFNMNSIKDRVVAVDGKVEIRPMMYISVTYDHRLIDGREAVTFLNTVKKYIEDPSSMLLA